MLSTTKVSRLETISNMEVSSTHSRVRGPTPADRYLFMLLEI